MSDAFTRDDYAELLQRLRAATDDDVTAILSNNFNVVLGALAALPLIRAAALEDVVQVIVHSQHIGINATVELVRSVRALKEHNTLAQEKTNFLLAVEHCVALLEGEPAGAVTASFYVKNGRRFVTLTVETRP